MKIQLRHNFEDIINNDGGTRESTTRVVCSNTSMKDVTGIINWASCLLIKTIVPFLFSLATVAFLWGVIQFYLNPDNEEKAIDNIASKLSVDKSLIKEVFTKYVISRIFRISIDITGLITKQKECQTNLANLSTYVWQEKYKKLEE